MDLKNNLKGQGSPERHESVVDSEHRAGAKSRQVGGNSTAAPYCQDG